VLVTEIIRKKRDGDILNKEELEFIVNGFVKGEIPDYQMSAFLMAIYFRGMSKEELVALTMLMAKSGKMVDLSSIDGIKVDKHSSGGIADTTTLGFNTTGSILRCKGCKDVRTRAFSHRWDN